MQIQLVDVSEIAFELHALMGGRGGAKAADPSCSGSSLVAFSWGLGTGKKMIEINE